MSRIGKKPIEILENVKAEIDGRNLKVSGPKGELKAELPESLNIEIKDNKISISINGENPSKKTRALWGLHRALVYNMIFGVSKGFEKKLEIEGVGYRAVAEGEYLILNVGFINPVRIKKPEGINFSVEKNVIIVSGTDKEKVGQISAIIRKAKKAEPYKGKGIKYQGEKIRRKEGKKVVAAKK